MSKTINQDTLTTLAGYGKPCFVCNGLDCVPALGHPCYECHGTGWLYALPDLPDGRSVRVKCENNYHMYCEFDQVARPTGRVKWAHSTFEQTNCIGFTGSTDLQVWLDTVWQVWPDGVFIQDSNSIVFHPEKFHYDMYEGDTLYSCIEQVLEAMGYTGGHYNLLSKY